MKTQIITLESHDDLISVRDRMQWAKTPRILLVWPKHEDVSLRLLDLKVLQRHADSLGAQLGLVTLRSKVRRDAESLGIPVFDSTPAAQRDQWPVLPPRRRLIPRAPRRDLRKQRDAIRQTGTGRMTSLAGRVATFAVGVTAVLVVAGLFIPRASVTLYPETQVQSVVIPVSASEAISTVSLTGSVPARIVAVTLEGEQTLAVSSPITIPKTKAKGVAQFTNLSQSEVIIPAGTVVIAPGETTVRFVTLQETRIPAEPGQFVDAPVEAVAPGTTGNVDAGAINTLEGLLGLSLSVTNPEPTSGGTELKTAGPSENDRARLRNILLDDLRQQAASRIRAELAEGDILFTDTLDVSQIARETFSPPAGQPGRQLTLSMEVEFAARTASADDLNQLASAALDASRPAGYQTFFLPALEPVKQPVTDSQGVTSLELKASRTLHREVRFADVFALVRGQRPAAAENALAEHIPSREPPEIVLTPGWWPWLPLIPFNLSVVEK